MSALPFNIYGYGISVLVISIMLSLSGIILGIGFAIDNKKLKEFGKTELMQGIINGMLVGGLLALFMPQGPISSMLNQLTMENASISCTGALAINPAICFAYNYLVGPAPYTFMNHTYLSIFDISTSTLIALYALYAVLGILSQFLGPVLSQIKYISQLVATAAISADVQAALLSFAAASTLTLILPLGIILRAFYPSRKLGGFLIALAIGMYVVLPLSYVLNAAIAASFSNATSSSLSQISITSNTLQSAIGASAGNQNLLSEAYGLVKSVLSAIENVINMLLTEVAYLIVYSFVLPIFSLVLTGISIKELAGLLGSDASFINRLNLV